MSETEEKTEQCRLGYGFNGGSHVPDDCPAAAKIPFFTGAEGRYLLRTIRNLNFTIIFPKRTGRNTKTP